MNIALKDCKKMLIIAIMSLFILPLFSITASATADTVDEQLLEIRTQDTIQNGTYNPDDELPKVSMDDAKDFINRKGADIIDLMQTFAGPFVIVIFIACAILTIVGSFGHSGFVGKGIVGMLICGVCYVCINFAPELIQFFSTWLSS